MMGIPADVIFAIIGFAFVAGYIVNDIIEYAPGEKRQLELERKAQRHTRSHHYKLPRNSR